jgi:peptidoglycan glycosyltransferase
LSCVQVPQGPTLADAVAAACPAPLTQVGGTLGAQSLETTFRQWGLDTPPRLEIPTESGEVQVTDPRLAAIGQEALTVTPLRVALVAATIGNNGVTPATRLVLQTESTDATWHPTTAEGEVVQTISPDLAEQALGLLTPSADGKVLGYSSLALAGADQLSHSWFFGLAPAENPRYAVVVLLEQGGADGLALAERIGHDALISALDG